MKKSICFAIYFSFVITCAFAQDESASDPPRWQFNPDASLYFIPNDFFILPIFRADKNKLHLEARYNYEDRETFSGWIGYNFIGGNNLAYTITPMIGGVVGLSNGIAPGIEITLTFKDFELYSESELYFDFETNDYSFIYTWTDLTYSPTDWLWFGISAQRTRLYQTDLDIQRGLLVGVGFKQWELTTYVYNLGFDDPFFLVNLSLTF